MAGRRPKPTAIKQLEGNPGKRALNAEEPKPLIGTPEMPKGMGRNATRIWKRKAAELLSMKVLTVVDGLALANFAKAEALGELFFREAIEEPYVLEPIFSKDGDIVGHKKKLSPATMGFALMSRISKGYQVEFGLTPASRSKLKVESDAAKTEEFPKRPDTTPTVGGEVDLESFDETKFDIQ